MAVRNIIQSNGARTMQGRFADMLELTKLELTALSVLTALCGFYIASDSIEFSKLFWMVLGTWLVGAAAGVFNQFQERSLDSLMKRTERRPLPAGRITPIAAFAFGMALTGAGSWVLYELAHPLAMVLGLVTIGFYIIVYTPLKRKTPFATAVGAIPGAMPPLIGWAAARGELEMSAWLLFGLVYLWQLPHFLAIAWMYHKDYLRAGFKVLSVSDARGRQTGVIVLLSTAMLVPESLGFYFAGEAGLLYLIGGLIAGGVFFSESWRFFKAVSRADGSWSLKANTVSRRLFFASLLYLPTTMVLLAISKQ